MARDRRAAPRGRYTHDAPLAGRRVWDVGDWGNASGYIGRQWERLGAERLIARAAAGRLPVVSDDPPIVVPLAHNDAWQRHFSNLGLTNADVLVIARRQGGHLACSVDFKWSIETASERQVAAIALAALLDSASADLTAAIETAAPACPIAHLEVADGFFFSPRSLANDAVWHGRTHRGLAGLQVIFEPMDGPSFFSPLPGWAAACQLAELDRRPDRLRTLDGAEHYYRLGVGVSAAHVLLGRSIFEAAADPAPPEPAALPLADWGQPSSTAIVTWFSPRIEERKVLTRRLRDTLRPPYSLRDFLRDRAAWYPPPPLEEGAPPVPIPADLREQWEPAFREIVDRHRAAILDEGRALLSQLSSEAAVLDQLARRRTAYLQRVRKWVNA